MADIVFLVGKILFVALLVILLIAIMKTGIGLVKGQREGDKTWKLYIKSSPSQTKRGQVIPVLGPLSIGRSPNCDIVIQDPAVTGSHEHARVSLDDEDLVIEDMRSTNGTFVNKRQISAPTYLKAGDTIQIGDTHIEVRHA